MLNEHEYAFSNSLILLFNQCSCFSWPDLESHTERATRGDFPNASKLFCFDLRTIADAIESDGKKWNAGFRISDTFRKQTFFDAYTHAQGGMWNIRKHTNNELVTKCNYILAGTKRTLVSSNTHKTIWMETDVNWWWTYIQSMPIGIFLHTLGNGLLK